VSNQNHRFFNANISKKGVFAMLQDKTIKQKDYERASQLLGRLFEVDSDITEQISRCIQYYGAEFFKNLESFDFSADVFEKLDAVRLVLFGMGEEVMPEVLTDEIRTQKIDSTEGGAEQ
jgi:hypothetical protein